MSTEYLKEKHNLLQGFGTWDTRSVTCHVKLPQAFAVNIGIKEYFRGQYLKEALIGRSEEGAEQVFVGPHTYDSAYSEVEIAWMRLRVRIRSAHMGEDLGLCVELIENTTQLTPVCVLEGAVLFNRPGWVFRKENELLWQNPSGEQMRLFVAQGQIHEDPHCPCQTGYLPILLNQPIYVCTGETRTADEIEKALQLGRAAYNSQKAEYGKLGDAWEAMQTVLAWNEIYEPRENRLTANVSRIWNVQRGGYGMFCWDNFFAALMIALNDPARGRMNAIEILNERTEEGFVPNCSNAYGRKTFDRSQPPVGSMVVREIYRRDPQKWFLEHTFPMLLEWNEWWMKARLNGEMLSWGSNPYDNIWEMNGVHGCHGGALESGMDNSPMYDEDEITFDEEKCIHRLWDVGLNSLYASDCLALSEIAGILGEHETQKRLLERYEHFKNALSSLWDDQLGFYYNYKTDEHLFSRRIAPSNFYPAMAHVPSQQQFDRMMEEHFFNKDEFFGEWILPAIARNDKNYHDNDYWRGRIWAPVNFLVYISLLQYPSCPARTALSEGSLKLLMHEWTTERHIHENYNADTGDGDDVSNSDKFYHWGGLLAFIPLIENGFMPDFGKPLEK